MSNDCFFLNPLRRDGTSQRQRAVPALDPAWARIDERGLADLLVYARDHARLLQYYTAGNSPAGDWTPLIDNDATALVALLRHEDAAASKAAFTTQVSAVQEAAVADALAEYAELFDYVLQMAGTVDRWHGAFEQELAVWRDLDRLVRSALNDALRDALVVSLRVHQLDAGIGTIEAAVRALGPAWDMSSVAPDATVFPHGKPLTDEDRDEALQRLQRAFDRFYEALVYLAGNTGRYLRETLVQYPRHEPHMALFLAFLRLFRHAQHQLNGLGAKHLDFYYEDVLRLRHAPAVPDRAHLVLELAKNAAPHRVAARTALTAGKDPAGVEMIYETVDELVVNRAAIDAEHGLKTILVERDAGGSVTAVHAAPDADSGDGRGADLADEDGKWATLGSAAMPAAELGFAVASPMLRLSEGKRVITLKLRLRGAAPTAGTATCRELERNVKVAFTGDGGWLDLPAAKVAVSFADGNRTLVYTLTVEPDRGPILPCDAKVHAGGLLTVHPVMRFQLDVDGLSAAAWAALDAALPGKAPVSTGDLGITDYADEVAGYGAGSTVRYDGRLYRTAADVHDAGARPGVDPRWTLLERSYAYRHLEELSLAGLDIVLNVDGIRSLSLENDVGVLDPSKPFLPFGPLPKAGGSFLIGSADVFHKPVSKIELTVDWADLPTAASGFKGHYSAYAGGPGNNQHFTARVGLLDGGGWRDPVGGAGAKTLPLFAPVGETPLVARSTLAFSLDPLRRSDSARPFARFGTGLRQGFMRLQLGQSFLHAQYPQELAEAIAAQNPAVHPVPAAPYTPLISFLALDFEAASGIDWRALSKTDFAARSEQLFQLGPFGQREVFPIDADPTAAGVPVGQHLVPQFRVVVPDADDLPQDLPLAGALLVGVAHLEPPQNLTLLIRVAEGSEDPHGRAPRVVWSYAGSEEWIDFADTEVLADGTGGLLRSGIVRLAIPKAATRSATRLPGGLHWLRAAVAEETRAIPMAVALHAQAVAAIFVDHGNDPAHLASALPAGTIAKLKQRDAAVKSVTQPYASFGGRLPERPRAFRVRVSERLRHKGRAVSIYDYERLVLQEFPEVYKVKCLNHSQDGSEHAPGHVHLVVVPDLRNQNAVDPLRPRFSLGKLELIAARLREVSSDFVALEVSNPGYEAVRADFAVRFHAGFDRGLYTRQLQQDLIKFLSPWLYDEAADLTFGGRVHRSAVLNWVEELGYVDFVTDFELEQVLEDGSRLSDLEEARATTSSAALVSAVDHAISYATGSCVDHV